LAEPFQGFFPETFQFLADLAQNNDKAWFEAHQDAYLKYVKSPSIQFVDAVGELLQVLDPGIQAIPKVNKSLFKIYRDTRFSANKLPLKDHVGILFWSGQGKRMERPGFYFHMEKEMIYLGAGIYRFSKPVLTTYRQALGNPANAEALKEVIEDVQGKAYEVGGKSLKKLPRGSDPDMQHKDLLLYTGLHAGTSFKPGPIVYSDDLLPFVFEHYKNLLPLHEWFLNIL